MMASSFNTNILKIFFNVFVEQSLIFADKLEKVGRNGNEVTVLEHISECTLTMACGKAKYF